MVDKGNDEAYREALLSNDSEALAVAYVFYWVTTRSGSAASKGPPRDIRGGVGVHHDLPVSGEYWVRSLGSGSQVVTGGFGSRLSRYWAGGRLLRGASGGLGPGGPRSPSTTFLTRA